VSKRTGNDIWQSLNEFYLLETEENIHWTNELVNEWLKEQFGIEDASINLISEQMSQQLTHQKIKGQFIKIDLKAIPIVLKKHDWLPLTELKKLAFPKFINQFLEMKEVQKTLF
jgi:A/G-specific adenine glycosylase